MSFFTSKRSVEQPAEVVTETPTAPVVVKPEPKQQAQLHSEPSRGDVLSAHLRERLRDIPTSAIIEEWSQRPNPDVYPTKCPSAVAEAFFLYPEDGAVDFFERYFFPIERFDDDYSPEVIDFVSNCKSRALAVSVQHSVEQFGIEETLARIAAGLKDNELLASRILELTTKD